MIYLVAPFATATLPDDIPDRVLQILYDQGYRVATEAEYIQAERLIEKVDKEK